MHRLTRLDTTGTILDSTDKLTERPERLELSRVETLFHPLLKQSFKERDLPLPCILSKRLKGGLPDPALGRSRRANKGGVIIFVCDQTQIRQDVTHLGFVKKTLSTGNRIGNMQITHRLLNNTGLMISTIQNCKIFPGGLFFKTRR